MNLALLARRWGPRLLTPRVDVPLFVALVLLAIVGLMTLHSAAAGDPGLLQAQAMRFAFGFAVLWVISRIPPQQLRLWAPWLFALSVVLLLLVPFLGTGRSARSWLNLGFFYLQPAELLKLAVPLLVASWLHSQVLPPRLGALAVSAVIIGLPTALIAIQPDLGTALVVAASGSFVVFFAGIQWRWIVGLGSAALMAAPLAWPFLREYHRNRFMTFLNPEADPLGVGWNIIQSKIAVGSGGLFGKGWGQGTQSRLDFLPEHTTDFIFSVFAEEFGWVGVLAMLGLYLFIIGRSLWIVAQARDTFSRILGGALALTFFVFVLINGGMVAGMLPVVGVPMPLMSYGGTSAVSLLASFGVLMSIHSHRRLMGE